MGKRPLDFEAELNDPHNEWDTWIDDNENAAGWWHTQDEELERIEAQAEAEELRHNGYWD